ncbi:Na+/H+ antiporter subunit E [Arthrobacter sp. H14]|uniref:Na+/H+ antiporter subunit E n=1 Tax=Arthrobacter sp. H14 TaxID=1312959 RepID=UPI0004B028C7|nr:Na+/H+ antiporter subunit E [Arthrobacter sp. H14]
MKHPRVSLRQELPLVIWLVLIWGALWRDFSVGNLLFGALIALAITQLFYLPPVELSGRFNILHGISFTGIFLLQLVKASFEVFYLAVAQGPRLNNSVVAVQLRSSSDLLVTTTGHVISLIPGSLVVEVDRSTSTLYLHCMNVGSTEEADQVRNRVRGVEVRLIRAMGSREELELVRREVDGHTDTEWPSATGRKEDHS